MGVLDLLDIKGASFSNIHDAYVLDGTHCLDQCKRLRWTVENGHEVIFTGAVMAH